MTTASVELPAIAPMALSCRSITVRRGGRAILDEVSMDAHPGEVLALVGPNGAGKSTLLAVLAGDFAADRGSVSLGDRALDAMRARELARQRSVLPQRVTIEFGFTAREVVAMGRAPHPPSEHDEHVIDASMRATETEDLANRVFRTLSGGEQTRVVLARVLAQRTPIVLLDEPTAALDLRHQEEVMAIARRLAAQRHTVLAVLHDLNLAAAYADRIAVLHEGRVRAVGAPADVLTPDLVRSTYGTEVHVSTHPVRGCPLVIPSASVPHAPTVQTGELP